MNVHTETGSLSATDKTFDGTKLPIELDRILTRVRLRARRRVAWLRKLWCEESPGGEPVVTHAEIDSHLDDRDAPEAESEWYASDESVAQWNRDLADVEAAMAADDDSRLVMLCRIFGIEEQDIDLFQACLAVSLDPALSRVYAYLQDHAGRGYVTETLVARLFGHGRCCVWSPESPLRTWGLVMEQEVAPGEPPMLTCDRLVRDWLLGQSDLDEHLVGIATLRPPLPPLAEWPVRETARLFERMVNNGHTGRARVCISGPPGSGRRTLAACVSARLDLPLLTIDADRVEEQDWQRFFVRVQRQAYLDRCALAWYGESAMRRTWPQVVSPFPVQFMTCESGQTLAPVPGVVDYRIEMPSPSLNERSELWRSYVPTAATWPERDFTALVARHRVTPGEIAAVARKDVAGPAQATTLIRETQRYRLGKLAQPLECPFRPDDLVIGENLRQALEALTFEARERVAFWEQAAARRLFPQGRGLLGLFSGPPGTGKTMAAQVIAAELELDLFRIDLSAVVSKYVGETSQNLERILSQAEHMDVVLLFDEADALFGKRTEIRDAHDRFANTDTGYLLQAIENYGGVAFLATNKRGNIDPAFIRRIRYVLEFPRPDTAQRLRIWQRLVAELAGPEQLESLNGSLEALAGGVEVTGAQIKFAILAALFGARRDGEPLALRYLLRGLDRELVKEGRALSDRDWERLMGNGS
jgi:AAA+ superfamily predicted ATPase